MYVFFVLRYENRGVQWLKSQPVGPVGLPVQQRSPATVEYVRPTEVSTDTNTSPLSKSAKKNLKRKEKKRQQAALNEVSESLSQVNIQSEKSAGKQCETAELNSVTAASVTSPQDPQKRLRNLRKKLKQIDELQSKIDSKEIIEPTKEQIEKLNKREAILEEMEALEA